MANFRWSRTKLNALPPQKVRDSDSGFDLTLIELVKTSGGVEFYTTGIQVEPPYGWYFDMVPRSSMTKTGYILANSVGVIDQTYRGEIIVALIKINEELPPLQLPARVVQIIPRPMQHFIPIEMDNLSETERGDGGFGSTG